MKKVALAVAAVVALVVAAGAGALAQKVFKIGVGDIVFVKRSKTACGVSQPFNQVVCYQHDARGRAIAGSYGASTSGKGVAIVRFNANRKAIVVFKRRQ